MERLSKGGRLNMSDSSSALTIAIDARWIFTRLSGIGLYTRELVRELLNIDHENRYVLLFNNPELQQRTCEQLNIRDYSNVRVLHVPWGVFSPMNQITLPSTLKRERINVYHSTNYMIPLAAFPRNRLATPACVTTIHDVIPLAVPNHAPRSRKNRMFRVYKWLMREIARRSDAIITVSQASKKDIITYLHVPEERRERIYCIFNGVSSTLTPVMPLSLPPAARPAALPRTILYVGRFDPYKNLATLIRAFAILQAKAPFAVRLCITGEPDPRYPEAVDQVRSLGLTDHVDFTGYLSDHALLKQLQDADILAHPSYYEGFGLQVIEAMACGLPVVCSNRASLPEVAGDAALLIDPDAPQSLADAMLHVLADGALYEKLRNAGIRRASCFTWQKTARDTLSVYRSVS